MREKENEMRRKNEELKDIYEERLLMKDKKHMEQLEVMQAELKRYEIGTIPLIQKKSDYIASSGSIHMRTNYDKMGWSYELLN